MMSPSPVAQHAPTSSIAYAEDPAIGPSPTLQSRKKFKRKINYKKRFFGHSRNEKIFQLLRLIRQIYLPGILNVAPLVDVPTAMRPVYTKSKSVICDANT